MRVLGAFAFLAAVVASMPAYAQTVTCGNAGNRGAKIQGQQVYDNVPDYVESPPGTFVRNAMDFSANPSSRPTLGTGVTYTWSQGVGTPGVRRKRGSRLDAYRSMAGLFLRPLSM